MSKKDVLIRGVDDGVYRRAKAVAAARGMNLGDAVDEALVLWAKESETSELESEVDANKEFVRSNWNKIRRNNKGKAVVVAQGRLQGVFQTLDEARIFASKKRVALVFVVDRPPMEHEIEIGPELEV